MSRLTQSHLYLQRLGYAAPPPPTLQTLQDLQLRHVCTFAFESLSTLLRLPVPIDLPSVEQKVLLDGRGGYCYELNQLFLPSSSSSHWFRLRTYRAALTVRYVSEGVELRN